MGQRIQDAFQYNRPNLGGNGNDLHLLCLHFAVNGTAFRFLRLLVGLLLLLVERFNYQKLGQFYADVSQYHLANDKQDKG